MRERKWREIEELGCVTEFRTDREKKKATGERAIEGGHGTTSVCVAPFI